MESTRTVLLTRIQLLEAELAEIKHKLTQEERQVVRLEGIWKGVDFTDEEIEAARRSLFRQTDDV